MAKRVIGIALILLSVVLMGLVISSVGANMAHSGPIAGKITSYRQPFYGHGVWMVVFIAGSFLSFLRGVFLVVLGKRH